jgi:uncharacterized protein YdaT
MAKITEAQFWIDVLKKVFKVWAKKQGIRTSPKTWNQHVVPHKKGWAIKGEGNSRYTDTFRKQSTALRRAKRIAKKHNSSVIIHRADGSIRDRISYSH